MTTTTEKLAAALRDCMKYLPALHASNGNEAYTAAVAALAAHDADDNFFADAEEIHGTEFYQICHDVAPDVVEGGAWVLMRTFIEDRS